ncbi:MAG TPA: ribosome maturation factor RimM [Gemmatimonadaceae bacterium]|jgi:16S rRNA processing protein RimM|nr:ribosome maturation factor RimM [Gemmatimonadaceae bacterium]
MTAPELLIVGRVRKAHGIRGEVLVEPITDGPDAIFAPGRRVMVGTAAGDPAPDGAELHVEGVRPMGDGLLVRFTEIPDRSAAEQWRGRYFLVPAAEVPPPDEQQVYIHSLLGMTVVLASGGSVGEVQDVFELPQGLAIDVKRPVGGTVMVPFDERVVKAVDRDSRVITIDPPVGLLD